MNWRDFETDPPPHANRVIVTNNIKARDAHGQMSHIWIGFPIAASDPARTGKWVTFDCADRCIHNLTHWMPLPTGPGDLNGK